MINGKMKREQYRQKIKDFMLCKGIDVFWANSALKHIMLNFAGNDYWITDIKRLSVIVGNYGMVDKFTMYCTINRVNDITQGILTYTFDRLHKVSITKKERVYEL